MLKIVTNWKIETVNMCEMFPSYIKLYNLENKTLISNFKKIPVISTY